jgi:hypothetical protein
MPDQGRLRATHRELAANLSHRVRSSDTSERLPLHRDVEALVYE